MAVSLTGGAADVRTLIRLAMHDDTQDRKTITDCTDGPRTAPASATDADATADDGGGGGGGGGGGDSGAGRSFRDCAEAWVDCLPHLVSEHCCPRGLSPFSWLQLLAKNVGGQMLMRAKESESDWYSRARVALMLMYAMQDVFHRSHRLSGNVAYMLTAIPTAGTLSKEKKVEGGEREERKKEKVEKKLPTEMLGVSGGDKAGMFIVVPVYVCICVLEAIESVLNEAIACGDEDVIAVADAMLAKGDKTGMSRLCAGAVCPHSGRGVCTRKTRKSRPSRADPVPASEPALSIAMAPTLQRDACGAGTVGALSPGGTARGGETSSSSRPMLSMPVSDRDRQLVLGLCEEIGSVRSHILPDFVMASRGEYEKMKKRKTQTAGKISGINVDDNDIGHCRPASGPHESDGDRTELRHESVPWKIAQIEGTASRARDAILSEDRRDKGGSEPGYDQQRQSRMSSMTPSQMLTSLKTHWHDYFDDMDGDSEGNSEKEGEDERDASSSEEEEEEEEEEGEELNEDPSARADCAEQGGARNMPVIPGLMQF